MHTSMTDILVNSLLQKINITIFYKNKRINNGTI